jgi:hypothetical protein
MANIPGTEAPSDGRRMNLPYADYDERALTVAGLGHVALDAAAGDLTDVGGRLSDSGRFTDAANVAVYGTSSSLPT